MRIRIDLKIFIFLTLFYFTNQLRIYFIVMFFSLLHEFGHIVMGLILRVKLEKIEIMPFGLSAFFNTNFNKNNTKEIFISLAGPCTSFILAYLFRKIEIDFITIQEAVYSNILILIFNLLPIYPLDGGRIIKGILHITLGNVKAEVLTNNISRTTIILLTVISSIAVYYYKNLAIFLVCIFLWYITLKEKNDKYRFKIDMSHIH